MTEELNQLKNIYDSTKDPNKDLLINYNRLKGIKRDLDKNHDGKVSLYEILIGNGSSIPKYIAGIVGLFTAIAAIVQGFLAYFQQEEMNWIIFAITVCIVVALVFIWLILNKNGNANTKTIKEINKYWQGFISDRDDLLSQMETAHDQDLKKAKEIEDKHIKEIEDLKEKYVEKIDELKAENSTWRVKSQIYKFASDYFKKKYPNDSIPNIDT